MSVLDQLKELQAKLNELDDAIAEKEEEVELLKQERKDLQERITLATEVATHYELDAKEKLKSDSDALAELYLCFKTGELDDTAFKRFCEQTSIGEPEDFETSEEEEKSNVETIHTGINS